MVGMPARTLEDFIYAKKELKDVMKEAPTVETTKHEETKVENTVTKPEVQTPMKLGKSYVVSASYEGGKRKAYLKLYNEDEEKIYLWYDNTGHQPYCLSDLTPEELSTLEALMKHPSFDHFETVVKFDPLEDKEKTLTKVVAKDPLAIGGRPSGCIRDILPKAWEADIKYYENFIFDRDIKVGMPYDIEDGSLVEAKYTPPAEVLKSITKLFEREPRELQEHIQRWVNLLECPTPCFRRVALDIEVASDVATRVPNPEEANDPVIAVALVGSDGWRRILILRRRGVEEGTATVDEELVYHDRETDLLLSVFKTLLDYPFVITFNGDDFDLRYLFHRAENLGFSREQIPIELGRDFALVKNGVHIDLYKFFFNRSIQVYAFSQKYRETTLTDIGESLLGIGKVELGKPVTELSYTNLADYCLRDADLTYRLTSLENDLVMKLILVLARISRMPMEDLSRQGVSGWIRNLLRYEHRRRNWLIPRSEDVLSAKGIATTKAIIEGKKYRGAEVIEPKAGVYFNISVLDFQSMYPSIIKQYNLSFETVRCPHPECMENKVPDTTHWVCKKRRGISSLVIGSLKDLRVKWYKPKSRDKTLPKPVTDWYNTISNSLKVLLNAAYGVFGSEAFFLYCPPVAEATASIGRYAIMETVKKAQALGVDVVYGDTDSIFLEAPTSQQIRDLMEWSEVSLGMELDIDKVYRYAVFSLRKKNYMGVFPDGSVDIKGLTGKKRNTPEFLKKAFFDMIAILSEVQSIEGFEEAKKKINDLVKTCYSKLKKREYSLQDLAFNIMISRSPEGYVKTTPQHVKAAQQLAKTGRRVTAGDIISFVKVSGTPGVKPIQLASLDEVDVDKYVEYVQNTFQQVLDALDIDIHSIFGTTRLDLFIPS